MELEEIREHLDRIDNALVLLLAERQSFIPLVAEYKKKSKIKRYQPDREKVIFEKKRKLASENNLSPDLAEEIFKSIISNSHEIEKEIMGE
tara:strand:- start:437 stop:709 length:273 start_codon:yes stop_codon:yes gene_type:complete